MLALWHACCSQCCRNLAKILPMSNRHRVSEGPRSRTTVHAVRQAACILQSLGALLLCQCSPQTVDASLAPCAAGTKELWAFLSAWSELYGLSLEGGFLSQVSAKIAGANTSMRRRVCACCARLPFPEMQTIAAPRGSRCDSCAGCLTHAQTLSALPIQEFP